MDNRTLLAGAVLATGLAGLAPISRADIVALGNGIAVQESEVAAPSRGMTMNQVASKFGEPVTKVPAVGQPPISRWEYPGFVVYFEHEHVIHSVVSSSSPPPTPAADTVPADPAAPAAADSSAPAN